MSKNILIKISLLSLFVLAGCLFGSQAKASAATWCGVLAYAPDGNCLDGQDYTALTSLSGNSDQLKNQLINKLHNFENGQHFQQKGARYIEDDLGDCAINYQPCPGWENNLNQSSVTLSVQNYSYNKNTAYDPSADADIQYPDNDTRQSVVIRYNGAVVYAIKLDCGNPVGDLNPIPQSGWTLRGNSGPPDHSVAPGQTVTFHHGVTNNGPARASYTWTVQNQVNGGNWTNNTLPNGSQSYGNLPSRSPSNVGSGASFPDITTYSDTYTAQARYTVPGNAQPGFRYCQRINYTNATGPNTGDDHSSPVCITVPSGGGGGPSQCTSITIYDDGGHNVPGGSSNPRPTRTHVRVFGFNPNGGSPPSPYYGTSPGIDTVSNGNPIANGDHRTWDPLTPVSSVIYIQRIRQYKTTNGVWITYVGGGSGTSDTSNTAGTLEAIPCYSAACAISIDSQIPGDPNGVKAGQQFTVNYTVWNNGPGGDPTSITGHPFSLNNGDVNGNGSAWGFSQPLYGIGQGASESDSFTLTAPNVASPQQLPLEAHPAYSGLFAIAGAQCGPIPVNIYTQFTLSPHAQVTLAPGTEAPTSVNNDTWVTENGPTVSENVTSSLYETTAGGANVGKGNTSNGGPFGSGSTTCLHQGTPPYNIAGCAATYNGTYPPSAPAQAGDNYCATIHVPVSSGGWVGPTGFISGGSPADQTSCSNITNRPYFKVFNGGVSAGGSFSVTSGGSCNGGGALASWNNDTGVYPTVTSGDYGASAQLNAMALRDITGFASAQPPFGQSPNYLSFANTSAPTSDTYSPKLGGAFDPTGNGYCLTNTSPPTGVTATPGPYIQPPTTLNPGTKASVFVNGNVYISGNILYKGDPPGNTGASAKWNNIKDIPSFVLHATGNIYISPNVTELDGLYIGQGKIYTCADASGFNPMPASSIYAGCNKQLTVYGDFVANQVNMMRSFGSLRDETPTGGSLGTPPSTLGITWSCGGGPCQPSLSGMSCVATHEPSDPDTWADNQICTPASSSLKFAWTFNANGGLVDPNKDPAKNDPGWLSLDYWKTHGYPYCVQWDVPPDYAQTWSDNYLCSNQNKNFTFQTAIDPSSSRECTKIIEPADPQGQWSSGYYLCGDITPGGLGTPPGPPPLTGCSNWDGIAADWSSRETCAAEVFKFSPELYLTTPDVTLPGGNSIKWDAVTSLPPVL